MDIKSILNNWIVKNLLLGVAFVLALTLLVSIFLSIRTRHGRQIEVPDLVSLSYEEASQRAKEAGVKLNIMDSVYVNRLPKGAIVNQTPKAGSMVKPGRTVSVMVNSLVAKKVKMPSLVGVSLRQALAEINSKGLMVGKLQYVSDIATNSVLRQLYRGRDVKPGRMINSGSTIDLVLGLNATDGITYVPNLIGYKYRQAVDAIHDNSLNLNSASFDGSVHSYTDSLNAVVYSQKPQSDGGQVVMGRGVTIYLTVNPDKLKKDE